jgi:hypothetical protein
MPAESMSTKLSEYEPPEDDQDLVLTWIRRARESQMSHYEMANILSARDRWLGVPVISIAAVVGTSVFASLTVQAVAPPIRIALGLLSVLAAVLAAMQTFFRFAQRAEKHRAAGARYGATRRKLEAIYAGDSRSREGNYLSTIREELDRLADISPHVPPGVFNRTRQAISHRAD